MIDDFNKRQRVIDLGEEAEDELLESTGKKTVSNFDTPQYRKVIEACERRSEIPTMDWCPDEDNPPDIHPLAVEGGCNPCEEFMDSVYEKELGSDLEKIDDGVAVGLVDFTEDSEYKRLYGSKD